MMHGLQNLKFSVYPYPYYHTSAILKTSKPLKSLATAHARITKSLFQHFKSFTSCFTQSHTELDAHPLLVNFRHTADVRKSQTAGAIHT
jgi:hypothetical protein